MIDVKSPSLVEEEPKVEVPVPSLVEVLPKEDEKSFKRDTKLTLRFSLPLDQTTLTVNEDDNKCSGTVQLSTDGFKTCIRLEQPTAGSDRKEFIVAPKGIYQSGKTHRLRLIQGIRTVDGGKLKAVENSKTFRTYSSQQLGSPGNDRGLSIEVNERGDVYVAGSTANENTKDQNDIFLAKFSFDGRQLWIRQAGFGHRPESCGFELLSDGKIRLYAHYSGEESSKMLLVDFNKEGELLWKKNHEFPGSSNGSAIAVDSNLNLISSGNRFDPLVNIQSNGTLGWTAKWKTPVRFEKIILTEKFFS